MNDSVSGESTRAWIWVLLVGLLGLAGGWWLAAQRAPAMVESDVIVQSVPGEEKNSKAFSNPRIVQPSDLIGQPRPEFSHGNIHGDIVQAADFDGQVVLINFWATWCAPCRAEMPMLQALHEQWAPQGFTVVGIALDDLQQVRDFVTELGITYPILVGAGDVMASGVVYGNRAGLLPYSVLVDRAGVVRWAEMGEIEAGQIEALVTPLL